MSGIDDGGRQDRNIDSCPLLRLPPLPLELIWRNLDGVEEHGERISSIYQHPLRCTCKAMRRASAALINSLHVKVWLLPDADNHTTTQAESQSERQLSGFPSDAQLTGLTWIVSADDYHLLDPTPMYEVLSSVFWRFLHKLKPLERLQVSGLGLNALDLTTLVLVCPRLEELDLTRVNIVGNTLVPLCKLSGLQSLSLTNPHALHIPSLQKGLAPLTQLTSLSFVLWPEWWDDDAPPPLSAVQQYDANVELLLLTVATLRGLKELSMQVQLDDDDDINRLHQLSSMTALTSLMLVNLADNSEVELAVLLPYLAPLQQLARLHLPDLTLDNEGVRALAALPLLADVRFGCCAVDSDVSELPCRWRRVQCQKDGLSYHHLAWLPLGSTTHLGDGNGGLKSWEWSPDAPAYRAVYNWVLGQGGEDLDTTCRLLERAVKVLVRLGQMVAQLKLALLLPRAPASRILQAIAPLDGDQILCVTLEAKWTIDASLAQSLAASLPSLVWLQVRAEGPGFPEFVMKLATGLPNLRQLELNLPYNTAEGAAQVQLSEAACSALLDLLAASKRPLRLHCRFDRGNRWQTLLDRARKHGLEDRVISAN